MRRLLPLLLALCLLLGGCAAARESLAPAGSPAPAPTAEPSPLVLAPAPEHPYRPLPVYIDGLLTLRGYLRGGTAYLPPESLCAHFGIVAETRWDGSSFTLRLPGLDVVGQDGLPYVTADGRYLYTPDGWFQADGLLYLPADAVERLLGLTVTLADDLSRAELIGAGCRLLRGGEDYYARTTQADDLFWLIHIIYSEAHHESLAGQIGVGNVVLNRVASDEFPATIMAVVLDREHTLQFSPVGSGEVVAAPDENAEIAAYLCLEGYKTAGDALYFVNPERGDPSWFASTLTPVCTIGSHQFYR